MTDTNGDHPEPGFSTLTRRDRLERIASAERDRRADRIEIAVAAIGEAVEWPARAVLALARLPDSDGVQTRRLLEEGLDLWAHECGLGSLDPIAVEESETSSRSGEQGLRGDSAPDSLADQLDRPLDSFELDRAFEEAKAEVEKMHDVNHVAERVLLDEPTSMTNFGGEDLTPVDAANFTDVVTARDDLGLDAAYVEPMHAAQPATTQEALMSGPSSDGARTTLGRWLQNLERRTARRMR